MLSKFQASLRNDTSIWVLAALTLAMHLGFAGRYDIFRNELYYIVCGRHPAFGYADQPPLVPLMAAASQVFGLNVWLLRLPAAIAAAALVPLTSSFTRLLGGGRGAALVAALAGAMSPALIALTQIMTTSTFEPLAWTAFAYLIARTVVAGDRHALIWAGAVGGVALQAKYGIFLWVAGLAAGLILTPGCTLLAMPECWIGVAVALLIAAPSLIWQTVNGWPFLAVMMHHTVTHSNFTGDPLVFTIGQALAMNALLAPLWLAGLVAPFVSQLLKPARFLAIGYCVTAVLIIAARGKDYYLFPAYPCPVCDRRGGVRAAGRVAECGMDGAGWGGFGGTGAAGIADSRSAGRWRRIWIIIICIRCRTRRLPWARR